MSSLSPSWEGTRDKFPDALLGSEEAEVQMSTSGSSSSSSRSSTPNDDDAASRIRQVAPEREASPHNRSPPSLIGGRYKPQNKLVGGGMSEVLLAVDLGAEQQVQDSEEDQEGVRHEGGSSQPPPPPLSPPATSPSYVVLKRAETKVIAKEIKLHRTLDHPNIVKVLEDGLVDGEWIVLEYVDGGSASSLRGKLKEDFPALVEIGLQTLYGLQYLHSKKILHRDIKPGNILICRDGFLECLRHSSTFPAGGENPPPLTAATAAVVKISDFGISRMSKSAAPSTSLATQTGYAGTDRFSAPESKCNHFSTASDIYSWACTIVELVTGVVGPNGLQKANLPPTLTKTLFQCLNYNPQDRPTIAQLVDLLENIRNNSYIEDSALAFTDDLLHEKLHSVQGRTFELLRQMLHLLVKNTESHKALGGGGGRRSSQLLSAPPPTIDANDSTITNYDAATPPESAEDNEQEEGLTMESLRAELSLEYHKQVSGVFAPLPPLDLVNTAALCEGKTEEDEDAKENEDEAEDIPPEINHAILDVMDMIDKRQKRKCEQVRSVDLAATSWMNNSGSTAPGSPTSAKRVVTAQHDDVGADGVDDDVDLANKIESILSVAKRTPKGTPRWSPFDSSNNRPHQDPTVEGHNNTNNISDYGTLQQTFSFNDANSSSCVKNRKQQQQRRGGGNDLQRKDPHTIFFEKLQQFNNHRFQFMPFFLSDADKIALGEDHNLFKKCFTPISVEMGDHQRDTYTNIAEAWNKTLHQAKTAGKNGQAAATASSSDSSSSFPHHHFVLVESVAGSGKTTLVKWSALNCQKFKNRAGQPMRGVVVVDLLPLGQMMKGHTASEWLECMWRVESMVHPETGEPFVHGADEVASARACLEACPDDVLYIFDGYDEVQFSGVRPFKLFLSWLQDKAKAPSMIRNIIMTSRPERQKAIVLKTSGSGGDRTVDIFKDSVYTRMTLQRWSRQQCKDYIAKFPLVPAVRDKADQVLSMRGFRQFDRLPFEVHLVCCAMWHLQPWTISNNDESNSSDSLGGKQIKRVESFFSRRQKQRDAKMLKMIATTTSDGNHGPQDDHTLPPSFDTTHKPSKIFDIVIDKHLDFRFTNLGFTGAEKEQKVKDVRCNLGLLAFETVCNTSREATIILQTDTNDQDNDTSICGLVELVARWSSTVNVATNNNTSFASECGTDSFCPGSPTSSIRGSRYKFLHKTLMEFLAAEHIVNVGGINAFRKLPLLQSIVLFFVADLLPLSGERTSPEMVQLRKECIADVTKRFKLELKRMSDAKITAAQIAEMTCLERSVLTQEYCISSVLGFITHASQPPTPNAKPSKPYDYDCTRLYGMMDFIQSLEGAKIAKIPLLNRMTSRPAWMMLMAEPAVRLGATYLLQWLHSHGSFASILRWAAVEAVSSADGAAVLDLLKTQFNVRVSLADASRVGNDEVVQRLLQEQDPEVVSADHVQEALEIACRINHCQLIAMLLPHMKSSASSLAAPPSSSSSHPSSSISSPPQSSVRELLLSRSLRAFVEETVGFIPAPRQLRSSDIARFYTNRSNAASTSAITALGSAVFRLLVDQPQLSPLATHVFIFLAAEAFISTTPSGDIVSRKLPPLHDTRFAMYVQQLVNWARIHGQKTKMVLSDQHRDRALVAPQDRNIIDTVETTTDLYPPSPPPQQACLTGWSTGSLNCIAFAPNSSLIATAKSDIRLWDPTTLKQVGLLKPPQGWVRSVAFSPDATRFVTTWVSKAIVWDLKTMSKLGELSGENEILHAVAFSQDAKHIITGGTGRNLVVWNATTLTAEKDDDVLRGHSNWIWSVMYSFDSSRVVSGSEDKNAMIWDLKSRKLLTTLKHQARVCSVAFSADASLVITGSGTSAHIWDVASSQRLVTLSTPNSKDACVDHVAFSPDSTRCLTAAGNATIIWDTTTHEQVGSIPSTIKGPQSAAFSRDSTQLSVSVNSDALLYDIASAPQRLRTYVGDGHQSAVRCVAFAPDSTRILAVGGKNAIIWDAHSNAQLGKLSNHPSGVKSVAYSPNQLWIATGSSGGDSGVHIWCAVSTALIATLSGHFGDINAVAFSPDSKRLVSVSNDGMAVMWDTASHAECGRVGSHFGGFPLTAVAFSADSAKFATTTWNATSTIWDANTMSKVGDLSGAHSKNQNAIAFSPNGVFIATGGEDDIAVIWDATNWKELGKLAGHTGWVVAVAFSPDSTQLVTGSEDGTAMIWDLNTKQNLGTLIGHSDSIRSVAFSPDATRIATGSDDKTVMLWTNTVICKLGERCGHTKVVKTAVISPDATQILTCSEEEQLAIVWDAATMQKLGTLSGGHTASILCAAFSPNVGDKIVTGSADKTAIVWSSKALCLLHVLRGHVDSVTAVAFSPDSTKIVSGSEATMVKIWDATTGQNLGTLVGHTRPITKIDFSRDGEYIITQCSPGTFSTTIVANDQQKADAGDDDDTNDLPASPLSPLRSTTRFVWNVKTKKRIPSAEASAMLQRFDEDEEEDEEQHQRRHGEQCMKQHRELSGAASTGNETASAAKIISCEVETRASDGKQFVRTRYAQNIDNKDHDQKQQESEMDEQHLRSPPPPPTRVVEFDVVLCVSSSE